MNLKKVAAGLVAAVGCATAFAAPAFASTYSYTVTYTKVSQGWWSGTWWDHNTVVHKIKTTNVAGCTTSLSGTDTVTYRMHQWNGILPATSLGDHEFNCKAGTSKTWDTKGGNHEYQWQLVGINGRGSGGNATSKGDVTTTD
jgi:hypothetical protein